MNPVDEVIQKTAEKLGISVEEVCFVMTLNESQRRAIDAWWETRDEGDYEFRDNHRYATKGNKAEEDVYAEQERQGCCGFVDVELQCDDGTTLLFGFNYGH